MIILCGDVTVRFPVKLAFVLFCLCPGTKSSKAMFHPVLLAVAKVCTECNLLPLGVSQCKQTKYVSSMGWQHYCLNCWATPKSAAGLSPKTQFAFLLTMSIDSWKRNQGDANFRLSLQEMSSLWHSIKKIHINNSDVSKSVTYIFKEQKALNWSTSVQKWPIWCSNFSLACSWSENVLTELLKYITRA